MQTKMIACPFCGAANSERKQVCYQCQQNLVAEKAATTATASPRAPKAEAAPSPAPPAPMIDATTAPVRDATPPPTPAPHAPRKLMLTARLSHRAQMYRQLQNLLKTGISVGQCLNFLESNIPPFLRPMVHDMAQTVQTGERLSKAMSRYYSVFPDWEVSMVQAAETGGTLPEAMETIANTLEEEMLLRSQTWVKMMPLAGTGLTFILTILIVVAVGNPAVQGNVSAVMASVGMAVLHLGAMLLAGLLLWRAWRIWGATRQGARIQQAIITRLPLIGAILHNTMRLRFTRVLAALWRAGVSPIESLETAARASGSPDLRNRATEQVPILTKGGQLSTVLSNLRLYPQEAVYLVSTGETAGGIAESLDKVAEYLELQLTEQLRLLPMRVQMVFYAILVPAIGYFVIHFWVSYYGAAMEGLNSAGGP